MSLSYKVHYKRDLSITIQENPFNLKGKQFEQIQSEFLQNIKSIKIQSLPEPRNVSNPNASKGHIRFLASIKEYSNLRYAKYVLAKSKSEKKVQSIPFINLKLINNDDYIDCFAITGKNNIEILHSLKGESIIQVTGVNIKYPVSVNKSIPMLLITNMEPVKNMSSFLSPMKEVQERANNILRSENIFKTIKEKLIKHLGIQSLEKTPKLESALDLIILQAFSGGTVGNASGKIHALVIGAPASGKKLLSDASEILNPTFQSITAAKVTIAGLSASTNNKDGKWVSTPGALARAHEGVISCQDFHNTSRSQISQIMGLFAEVMENGKFKDSTSANKEYKSRTGILIDLNRQSDLSSKKVSDYQEDIFGIPKNILSRFDYITEIEANTERQLDIAISMYSTKPLADKEERNKEKDSLKLVVAKLRDRHDQITIPKNVQTTLKRLHQELFNICDFQEDNLSAFQTRTANSAMKLVSTLARVDNRSSANVEDARKAFEFIQEKFRIISKIYPNSTNLQRLKGNKPSNQEIGLWLTQTFGIKKFTVQKATKKYLEHFKTKQSQSAVRRLIYRVLHKQGIKCQHKYYQMKVSK